MTNSRAIDVEKDAEKGTQLELSHRDGDLQEMHTENTLHVLHRGRILDEWRVGLDMHPAVLCTTS